MSTLNNQLFIDAVIVKGIGRTLVVSLNHVKEESMDNEDLDIKSDFEPMDLTPYHVRFRVLGSADGNGAVLIEKIITQDTDPEDIGRITNSTNAGLFSFAVNKADTEALGIGTFPISLELLDAGTGDVIASLTEGGIAQGEFSKIIIVRP